MLNSEIKRKIDNARDILVGKIPVPSQQIEQITIALIYKFMSDIDKQTKKLGGQGFFEGEYGKYSWDEIMDRKKGGQERLNLYSEGLDKMGTNPHLPQMFRDIFRNAYLPFKDPSTLDMFLKQIDEFSYDHSEDLGDAFEYLLSTAGSQGDAGQFRTPRHIIDFIVSIVQPQLTDTVLDPACGTAGFLISAYKYIMNQNKDKVAGDKLSLTQKKELTQHFVGYDISYEMVRLSLVNMYLHNFGDPKIYEYDTLSNDDRWDDRFDCILANPPFMTPKGGIQPHNRFSIKASKSEVLFVDYMIEHLNPHGKAGIVVPEGIIFQGANAYKDLRKKMIKENYLWAVVSLPAGVFQPYSGVKTSILLFDQELAKKTDKILFVKVQNDGFDLGAQRRPSNKNDIPKATEILLQYKKDLLGENEINLSDSEMNLLVSKEKIEENSEFNLSMDRYKPTGPINSVYDVVKLSDYFETITPPEKIKKEIFLEKGKYPIIDQGKEFIAGYTDDETSVIFSDEPLLIFGDHTCIVKYINFPFAQGADGVKIIKTKNDLLAKFLYYFLKINPIISTGYNRHFGKLKELEIPLPPLEVQEKIVAELDSYQKVIDGAKMIVDNYKPTIKINPDWEIVKLGDVCEKITDGSHFSPETVENGLPYITVRDIENDKIDFDNCKFINNEDFNELVKNGCNPIRNDILFSKDGTVGKVSLVDFDKKFVVLSSLAIIRPNINVINPIYLKNIMKSDAFLGLAIENKTGIAIRRIVLKTLKELPVPLPSLEEQNQIVAEIEKEEAMVENAKQLIEVFEKKIKDRIDEIWGK